MEIKVERRWPKDGYIIGRMYIDGEMICNTLEPPEGTGAETITSGSGKAIASGCYVLRMAWSERFGRRLPRVEGVTGRTGILIHAGNTVRDTRGCILVGRNSAKGQVLQSGYCLKHIIERISGAEAKGEQVIITIA